MRTRLWAALVLVICTLLPATTFGQTFADMLSDHAVVYVGWKGTQGLGAGYTASHLKAVLDACEMREFLAQGLPQLLAKIPPEQGGPFIARVVTTLGPSLWKDPCALYVGNIDAGPVPCIALLVRAGADADALGTQIQTMIPPGAPIKCLTNNGVVALILGDDPDLEARLANAGAPLANSLAARADFKNELAGLPADPVFVKFVDVDALVRQVDTLSTQRPLPGWTKARDGLGLTSIHRVVVAAGFDGPNWSTAVYVARSAGPGLFPALLSGSAVSDDALRLIPATASDVTAFHVDASKLFPLIRSASGAADPSAPGEFDAALAKVNAGLGIDVQKDLLDALGEDWVSYCDPNLTGNGTMCAVWINRLRNPAAVQHALETAEEAGVDRLSRSSGVGGMHFSVKTQIVDGVSIHMWPTMMFCPSWAIVGDKLYVGLYPQSVAAAAGRQAGGPSILDNADFAALRSHLGGQQAGVISFADLSKTLGDAYQTPMVLSETVASAMDAFGMDVPLLVIPPLNKLRPHMGLDATMIHSDDAGWTLRSQDSFPGARVFSAQSPGAMASLPLAASILLPSLSKAKEAANRGKSASNLSMIAKGCLLYANDHQGAYPPDLGALVREEGLPPQSCISPYATMPGSVAAGDLATKAAWVNANSDYVYLGAGRNDTVGEDVIIAYEKLKMHGGVGINILFGDGHVEFLPMAEVQHLMQEQKIVAQP